MEIRILHGQGLRAREIARRTGHSRNTVERYLRDPEAPRYTPRPAVAGKLSEHEGWLAERVRSALPERLSAVALLRELRERGYAGGMTILREGAQCQGMSSSMRLCGQLLMRRVNRSVR
jgi:transposase